MSKGAIAGMRQRTFQIHDSMTFSVITADYIASKIITSLTIILILGIGRIFPHIFKCCQYLKSRPRRIQPLCRAVQKCRVTLRILYQSIPLLLHGIGIIIRFGNHCQNLSGRRFYGNHCSFLISQCFIGDLL